MFRTPDGAAPNIAALAFTLLGYGLSVWALTLSSGVLNLLGFAGLTLTLIWSAYYIHEFAHQAIFRSAEANERWGTLMSWLNGACYARFAGLRRKHMPTWSPLIREAFCSPRRRGFAAVCWRSSGPTFRRSSS